MLWELSPTSCFSAICFCRQTIVVSYQLWQRFWTKKMKLQFYSKQDQEWLYARIQRKKWRIEVQGGVAGLENMDIRILEASEASWTNRFVWKQMFLLSGILWKIWTQKPELCHIPILLQYCWTTTRRLRKKRLE